ncbi:hypothetical protein HED63_22360 [Ochrobactrum cytisi]|nr:hypothetical protein [Brucella cytisi]
MPALSFEAASRSLASGLVRGPCPWAIRACTFIRSRTPVVAALGISTE